MKEFKFPLDSLRVLRKQKEHVAQQRYARALDACQKADVLVQGAAGELETGRTSLAQELAGGITAGRLAGLRNWCLVLEIRWRERQAALTEARRVAGLIFREMTAATREREGLDRYHEKAQRAYELDVRRSEQKIFDEMAVQAESMNGLSAFAGSQNI
jgi:flagellar export protein FliJ